MFENISHRLASNPPRRHYGAAVVDVDGDGQFEIVVAGYGSANPVLKWDGERFVDAADPALADPHRQAIGVAAGDIDGDGREEIYLLNTDSFEGTKQHADRLLDARDGEWVDLFELEENLPAANLIAGRSVAALDRLGNGRYGFFVANYGGPMAYYEQGQPGPLVNLAAEIGLALSTGGRGVVSLPLVSEGADIFVSNEGGANYLFERLENGTYEEVGQQFGLGDMYEHGRGVSPVDASGDGRFGLVVGNWQGPHRLFARTGEGDFADVAPPALAAPSKVRTVIAADFDNDGFQEIFFNNIGQANRLFAWQSGGWTAVEIGAAEEPGGYGTGAVIGDWDGDGVLELLVTHGEQDRQPLTLFQSVTADEHHWLRVLPRTRQGAPARGAVVRCRAGGRTQIRCIDGGSGYLCQMEPVAHFGLGGLSGVEQVDVRWPGGAVASLVGPEVNRLHEVAYPGS